MVKGGGMKVDGTELVEGNAVRIASDLSGYLDVTIGPVIMLQKHLEQEDAS